MSGFTVAVGQSAQDSSADAGREAVKQVSQRLETPDLVFAFSGSNLANESLLTAIADELGEPPVIGCSTGGELADSGIATGSVVLMAVSNDGMQVGTGVGHPISADNREAGRRAADAALEDLDSEVSGQTTYTVFATALTGNGSEVMRGVRDGFGADAHITGGIAGDDWKLEETCVYHNNEVISDGLVVAAIDGPGTITHGLRHGLRKTANHYTVTASEANIVKELDGCPAAEIYEELYGPKGRTANFIMTKPLGIETGEAELRLRDPLIVNDDGSIVYAAEVQEDSSVYVMESPTESIIDAARTAAEQAVENAGGPAPEDIKGVIMHDCVCRWNCLTDDATREQEIAAVKAVVGEDTPVIGWYTYGEVALPSALAGVHNQTFVLQLFADE